MISFGGFVSWTCLVASISGFSPRQRSSASHRSIVESSSSSSRTTAYRGKHTLFDFVNGEPGGEESDPFAEIRRKFLENATPELPDILRPPSKSEVYGQDELESLWDLHKQLSPQTKVIQSIEDILEEEEPSVPSIHDLVMEAVAAQTSNDPQTKVIQSIEDILEEEEPSVPSIHDLVMEAVAAQTSNDDDKTINGSTINGDTPPSYPWLTKDIQDRSRKICAIASDVDGTLIGSDQKVHPRTKAAIEKAVRSAVSPTGNLKFFFPATGKTRKGAMNSLGPELAALIQECPGVFIQGLYCVYGDTVVFEKKLTREAVEACEKLVADTGTSIIAYDADNLYTNDLTQTVVKLHEIYGEPLSQEVSSIVEHAPGFHKILVCDEDIEKLVTVVRPRLEKLAAANNARVTQAMPTMLELLPEGCSKALGVQKLCEVLGVDPGTELLALGDAENDVEMLEMAAIGVVMGNGSPPAREAGDVILEETSDQGGAGLAMEVLGGLES
jgi:Cof subfamily protein (haloacid dehalogenase superfamily)